jgi:DNA-binding NtrC family response regulator
MALQTTDSMTAEAKILVVDSNRRVAAVYERWLDDACSTTVVPDGKTALERADGSFDAAIIDRRTADVAAVTAALAADADAPPVAVIVGVDSEPTASEVTHNERLLRTEFRAVVGRLGKVAAYDQQVRDRQALAERAATFETAAGDDSPDSDAYRKVRAQLDSLQTAAAQTLADMDENTSAVAVEHVLSH